MRRQFISFVLLAGLPLFVAPSAAAQEGATLAVVAVGVDAQSQAAAVDAARIAKQAAVGTKDLELVLLEKVLEGGTAPVWLEKRGTAEQAADKGAQAMSALELPVASEAYADALVAFEQAVAGMTDLRPIVEAAAQGGAALLLQGDKRGAARLFETALSVDPAYRLPKAGTNARVFKAFEDAAKDRRAAGQGTLTAYASAGPAEVWIDGVHRGTAPLSLDTPAGRHYVRMVRDGYLSFGTAVDVKRGSETSVSATLKPTQNLAMFEQSLSKLAREKDNTASAADVAVALQVDRLLAVIVESSGASSTFTLVIVDGVSGKELARGSKAFAASGDFFEHDIEVFVKEYLLLSTREGASTAAPTTATPSKAPIVKDDGTSMLPGDPEAVPTPGAVIGGWVMLGLAVIPVGTGIGFGIASYSYYDGYRNKLPDQLDPNLAPLRSAWLTTSILTDASWLVALGLVGGGVAALVSGYSDKAAKEEVLR